MLWKSKGIFILSWAVAYSTFYNIRTLSSVLGLVDKPTQKMPLRDVVSGSQSYETAISALRKKLYEHGSVLKVGPMLIDILKFY